VILFGLVGFGLWAGFVSLKGGVLASGHVAGETDRKTVQHLDGGIVSEILTQEGYRVTKGEVLLRLESVVDRQRADALERQLLQLLTRQSRLAALRADAQSWDVPEKVRKAASGDPELTAMVELQKKLLLSERDALHGQSSVLRQRAHQQETLIAALGKRDAARRAELELVLGQLRDIGPLVAKGYVPKIRQTDLRKERSNLEGKRAEIQGEIARAREVIAETDMQLAALRQNNIKAWADAVTEIAEQRMKLERELVIARDKLTRHDVVAPISGAVMNLNYVTKGGVIAPGAPILDIVPTEDALAVDVRIRPTDIDEVQNGMAARIRLAGLPYRSSPILDGKVTRISPDTHRDERTRETYYRARIRLSDESTKALKGKNPLYPGMPAEAVIVSSEYTLLGALLRPLADAMFRAFRQ
jgi:HlyD family type I secretion membrane fusion protein